MYNSAAGPAMPPMIEPIVGTGDAASVKEAEKLAAIHACLQLSARGLFTNVRACCLPSPLSLSRLARAPSRGADFLESLAVQPPDAHPRPVHPAARRVADDGPGVRGGPVGLL